VRLLKASIDMIKNHGLRVLLTAFGEKQLDRLQSPDEAAAALDKKIKLYQGTTKLDDPRLASNIVCNERAVTPDESLRKHLRAGSSEILKLQGNPKVSIIISTLDQTDLLKRNLESIESKTTYKNYEIIIVTNNKDKNSEMRRYLDGVKHTVLIYDAEYSFSKINNYASKSAGGEYLLFLNDDVEIVSPSWLEAMLKLASDARVGAVGGKLLSSDGSLQEAGCIVWRNGNVWNYGRGDDPNKPDYNFVRDVDYCSGCCLLVKREIFEMAGRFDVGYEIAYCEDNDLCHAIRQKGYRVMYQPLSCIVHYEGKTQGTDVSAGIKSMQVKNQKKFTEKWSNVLKNRSPDSAKNAFLERSRTTGLNILYIDRYVPEHDKDSGSLDSYYLASILSYLDHDVTFWPDNKTRAEPYTTELQQKRVEVIYGPHDFRKFLKSRGDTFHVCIVARSYLAAKYLGHLKRYAPKCRIVYDSVDLPFIREYREAVLERDLSKIISASRTCGVELSCIDNSDVTIVRSLKEARFLLNEDSDRSVAVIPPLQIPQKGCPSFEKRKDLLFLGGFQHAPNVGAIEYLIGSIFPRIRMSLPDVKLYVIGSHAPEEVRTMCTSAENVVFLGYVPGIEAHLNNCRLMLAPLTYGAGVKGKITKSFAHGLPVVTTSIGAEGVSSDSGKVLLIEDDPAEFASKAVEAYTDKELWSTISKNCLAFANDHYSPELVRSTLTQMLERCLRSCCKHD